ncbi:hypothetical protein K440DRAFT_643261 [Wilcoxina mikolae CBS 423.85]|nr:hypothetical protein K440DRAFT_643261 [Wilcoxina mikolae CBS 423.85]
MAALCENPVAGRKTWLWLQARAPAAFVHTEATARASPRRSSVIYGGSNRLSNRVVDREANRMNSCGICLRRKDGQEERCGGGTNVDRNEPENSSYCAMHASFQSASLEGWPAGKFVPAAAVAAKANGTLIQCTCSHYCDTLISTARSVMLGRRMHQQKPQKLQMQGVESRM